MLRTYITCFMPQGILSIDVPIMVFQIIKLKTQSNSSKNIKFDSLNIFIKTKIKIISNIHLHIV